MCTRVVSLVLWFCGWPLKDPPGTSASFVGLYYWYSYSYGHTHDLLLWCVYYRPLFNGSLGVSVVYV
jgi:hypothetical protein